MTQTGVLAKRKYESERAVLQWRSLSPVCPPLFHTHWRVCVFSPFIHLDVFTIKILWNSVLIALTCDICLPLLVASGNCDNKRSNFMVNKATGMFILKQFETDVNISKRWTLLLVSLKRICKSLQTWSGTQWRSYTTAWKNIHNREFKWSQGFFCFSFKLTVKMQARHGRILQ